MYFLDLADEHIEAFKQAWGEIGDSIVVVGGDGLWNCHVHTNDIGAAIEAALDLGGRPRQIRVTDLFEEVADEHASARRSSSRRCRRASAPAASCRRSRPRSSPSAAATGSPSCSAQLGVQGIVTRRADDEPVDRRAARRRRARQRRPGRGPARTTRTSSRSPSRSTRLTAKTVRVVPTRSMPEGLAALMVYDPEATRRRNVAEMSRRRRGGRDRRGHPGGPRPAQPTAGPIADGRLDRASCAATASSPSRVDARRRRTALLEHLVDDERELVTVITGADADAGDTAALVGVARRRASRTSRSRCTTAASRCTRTSFGVE